MIIDDFPTFDLPQKHTSGRPSGGMLRIVRAPAINVSLSLRVVPIISTRCGGRSRYIGGLENPLEKTK